MFIIFYFAFGIYNCNYTYFKKSPMLFYKTEYIDEKNP